MGNVAGPDRYIPDMVIKKEAVHPRLVAYDNKIIVTNEWTEVVRVSVRSLDQEKKHSKDQRPGQVLTHYTKGRTNSRMVHLTVTGKESGKTASIETESDRSVIITKDFKLKKK